MCAGQLSLEMTHAVNPAHLGQVDVHEHHVRFLTRDFLQRILRRPMAAQERESRRPLQLMLELFAHHIVIFDHADAHRTEDRHIQYFRLGGDHSHDYWLESPFPPITRPCSTFCGTSIKIVVPSPGRLLMSRRPPIPRRRRRMFCSPLPACETAAGSKPLPLSAMVMLTPSSLSLSVSCTSVAAA